MDSVRKRSSGRRQRRTICFYLMNPATLVVAMLLLSLYTRDIRPLAVVVWGH